LRRRCSARIMTKSVDSHELFDGTNIASKPSYGVDINKYDVMYVDMGGFISRLPVKDDFIDELKKSTA